MRTLAFLSVLVLLGCGHAEDRVSSRSYQGHENDIDANNLVSAYPSLVGTRLDDCQTCHSGRIEDGKLVGSSCDNCHDLVLHGDGHTFRETLNSFGVDYLEAGRNREALTAIKKQDSDGDGFSNDDELEAQRYPGNGFSMPGQATAKLLVVSLQELKAMPSHTQLMLSNASRQKFDEYVVFRGVKIKDLLESRGISLEGAAGITVIAPDGYMKSLPIEFVDRPFPEQSFLPGLDVETLGEECGFVNYPENVPDELPEEHWLMLGYERNGAALDKSVLDVAAGRITGEGPLRIIVPQATPGKPDRGSRFSPTECADGFDFDEYADHNAGSMVRGVIAIRIDPMPAGVEEFDYMNGGWAYINAGQSIIYGHGVER
jgi:hypothetical protein